MVQTCKRGPMKLVEQGGGRKKARHIEKEDKQSHGIKHKLPEEASEKEHGKNRYIPRRQVNKVMEKTYPF